MNNKMIFDGQLLVHAMIASLYISYSDYTTASDIIRWVVHGIQTHPYDDTLLNAVFCTEVWCKLNWYFCQALRIEKYDVTVDVTFDKGENKKFKTNSDNMGVTKTFQWTLPVHKISCSVRDFGFVSVRIMRTFAEKEQQQKTIQTSPFKLSQKFISMPYHGEIKAETSLIYKPATKDKQLAKECFNHTMIIEVELPTCKKKFYLNQIFHFINNQ
jgi:hypothetical protein